MTKVSVCITTYQHSRYIADAIESVLMQKASFPFEILIGDDGSTDGTAEIVRFYAQQYPSRIRAYFHAREQRDEGVGPMNFGSARNNFVNNLQNATGTYIALLDGDDYWTDESKLQYQVDFLDQNTHLTACFTDYRIKSQDGSLRAPRSTSLVQIYELKDVLVSHPFCSATMVLRNHIWSEFPAWFFKMPGVFWPLVVMCAQRNPVALLPRACATYRLHSNAVHSNLDINRKHELAILGREILAPVIDKGSRVYLHKGIDICLRNMWINEAQSHNYDKAKSIAQKRLRLPIKRRLFDLAMIWAAARLPPAVTKRLRCMKSLRPAKLLEAFVAQ